MGYRGGEIARGKRRVYGCSYEIEYKMLDNCPQEARYKRISESKDASLMSHSGQHQ
jgi:hypothetical protein